MKIFSLCVKHLIYVPSVIGCSIMATGCATGTGTGGYAYPAGGALGVTKPMEVIGCPEPG